MGSTLSASHRPRLLWGCSLGHALTLARVAELLGTVWSQVQGPGLL